MLSLFCCGVISFSFFIFLKTSQKEFPGDVSVFTPHHMWACVILPSILEWEGRAPGAPGSSSSPGAGEDLEEKGLSRLPPDLLGPRASLGLENLSSASRGLTGQSAWMLVGKSPRKKGLTGQEWECSPGPREEPLRAQRKGFMSRDNVLP